jgi:hypothetical protein
MDTTTPADIHDTIVRALGDRARLMRATAASRKWGGDAKADSRRLMRQEAKLCDDLQRILGHVSPEKLAAALEG